MCWTLLGKIREITMSFYELIFRQVSVIKNHCAAGAVRCPFHGQGNTRITTDWPRCMSTWHQLLQWVDNNSGTFFIFIYYLNFWRSTCKIFLLKCTNIEEIYIVRMLLENNFNPLCHITTSGAQHSPAFTIYQEMTFSHKIFFLYDFKVQTYLFFTVNPTYSLDSYK